MVVCGSFFFIHPLPLIHGPRSCDVDHMGLGFVLAHAGFESGADRTAKSSMSAVQFIFFTLGCLGARWGQPSDAWTLADGVLPWHTCTRHIFMPTQYHELKAKAEVGESLILSGRRCADLFPVIGHSVNGKTTGHFFVGGGSSARTMACDLYTPKKFSLPTTHGAAPSCPQGCRLGQQKRQDRRLTHAKETPAPTSQRQPCHQDFRFRLAARRVGTCYPCRPR